MATSKIGEMPLQFPEVEQYFKRLQFFLEASDKLTVGKRLYCLQLRANCVFADRDVNRPGRYYRPRRYVERHPRCRRESPSPKTNFALRTSPPTFYDSIQRHRFYFRSAFKGSGKQVRLRRIARRTHKSFIFGLSDHTIRSKLLSTTDLTLDSAVQQAMLRETVELASGTVNSAVSALAACKPSKQSCADDIPAKPRRQKPSFSSCYSCGSTAHQRSACRFRQATCHVCGKSDHISTVCRLSSRTSNALTTSNSDHSESDLTMASDGAVLNLVGGKDNLWRELCQIGGTMVDFLIDTDSQATILPASSAASTRLPVEPAPSHILRAYGGGRVPVIGKITNARIDLGNFSHSGCVLVTDDSTKPILGMDFLPSL